MFTKGKTFLFLVIRHSKFVGLREDKDPRAVTRE
jgi:hypothetical protein